MSKPTIDPQRWQPPSGPPPAGYDRAHRLAGPIERIELPGHGPEDVVVDDDWIYTGLADGRVVRLPIDGGAAEQLCHTGGRPLGIELLGDGRLLVCDAHRGLMAVDRGGGHPEVLLDEIDGRHLLVTNNAAVTADGAIYFTESTTRFELEHFRADIIEHSATGSLFRFDSTSGGVDRVLPGLAFANGVALTADEQHVLVAETGGYAIHRVTLAGPDQGRHDVLVDNLPAHPDNLSTGPTGTIWIALPQRRDRALDLLLPRWPALRKLVWALPEALQPDADSSPFVLGIDANGAVTHRLEAPGDALRFVTGVREHDGSLYLGSLIGGAIGRIRL